MSLGHRKLSGWYLQLAQQLEAGLPLPEVLRLSRGMGIPERDLNAMARAIETGGSVSDALNAASPWLPPGDRLSLAAGAMAGRMPRTLRSLSARHDQLGVAKARVRLACLYPAAVLHLGLLLLPITRMIDWERGFAWDPVAYVRGLGFTLIPLWTIVIAVSVLVKRENLWLERLFRVLPIVRSYVGAQALSDFCFALGNFLEAGVPIDRAWAAAGTITRSPSLKTAAASMAPIIARGEPPGSRLASTDAFPPEFVALYRSGESSGQLEANLLRLAEQNQEKAQQALSAATVVYPGLVLVCVAGGVAYFVISVYGGYLKMLTGLVE